MRDALLALLVISLAIGLIVYTCQRWILFPIGHTPDAPPNPQLPGNGERLWIAAGDHRVEAWFLPGDGVAEASPGPVVLFAHGNAELIDTALYTVRPYLAQGVSVALLEYRGYGRSTGTPSEDGILEDAAALTRLLEARPDVDPARIIFHGRSLGGGVACGLARRTAPKALILESTFTSVTEMAWQMGVPGFLVRDPFDNRAHLSQLTAPTLILHGDEDEVVPVSHSASLKEAAPHAELYRWPAGHNDLAANEARYWGHIFGFLKSHGVLEDDTAPPPSEATPRSTTQ